MNKAFVREPEDTGRHYCPRCGALGDAVGRATLEAHLRADAADSLGDVGFFCPTASCDVAYFDVFERVVSCDGLAAPAYPKDRDAPMCGCFGLTEEDIEADLADGAPTRIRALLARSNTPEAHCATAAVNGRCCMPTVQRYYMQRRQGAGAAE